MHKFSDCFYSFLKSCVKVALSALLFSSLVVLVLCAFFKIHIGLSLFFAVSSATLLLVTFLKIKPSVKFLLIMIGALIIRVAWGIYTNSILTSDFLTIYQAAQSFLSGNISSLRGYEYLARFPHLVPMMLYMAGMIKVFGPYNIIAMKCVSIILSLLTVYLMYVLMMQYTKKTSTGFIAMCIAALFPPFVSYSSTFCTETIAVPLFILSVIIFNKSLNKKNKCCWFGLCGIILYISNLFRAVGIVFLIAFCIYALLYLKDKKVLSIISVVAGYLVTAILVSSVLISVNVTEQPLWKGKEPIFATSMLKGSNFDSYGMWNSDDANFVGERLGNDNLSRECFNTIKTRLSERNPLEVGALYIFKFLHQWSTGDFGGTFWATAQTPFHRIFPMLVFQLVYIIIIYLSLSGVSSCKNNRKLALPLLLLCGFGTSFIVLETQPRYSYIVSWIFIIFASYGIENPTKNIIRIKKFVPFFNKYKSEINYVLFGIITTVVNIVTYFALYNYFHISNVISSIIAWILSVLVAYITNKLWVFESKSLNPKTLFKEIYMFFSCRFLTGVIDILFMWIFVDLLLFNSLLIKIISNVIVIVLNYIISKFFIFKESKTR